MSLTPLRSSLRTVLMVSFVLSVLGIGGLRAAGQERPNVVVFLTDQQSATMLSAAGNPHLETPAIDSIASGGVRFEQAFVTNPVCSPSRISIMTGHMPSAAGVEQNRDARKPVPARFLKNTLGQLFQQAGYDTAYGGKVHLPPNMELGKIGFDKYLAAGNRRSKLAQASARYIKQKHQKSFFLFTSFINPHDICYMTIDDYRRWQGKKPLQNRATEVVHQYLKKAKTSGNLKQFVEANAPPLPENFALSKPTPDCLKFGETVRRNSYPYHHWSETRWRLQRWLYCRLTERVDRQVGTVLDAIDEAGLGEETLILYMSEHGEMDGAHHRVRKFLPFEEAARVPFMLKWEGHLPAGRVDREHLVSVGLDVIPTLCDFAGIEPPSDLLGRSVKPLAEGRDPRDWRTMVPIEFSQGRAIRTNRYKYAVYKTGERREQLFDLKKDPGELHNLAYKPEKKKLLNKMRQRITQWIERADDQIGRKFIISPADGSQ